MNQPTKEQWFWKRCGLKEVLGKEDWRFAEFQTTNHWWEAPSGRRFLDTPPIDLNNLFKYAVPEDRVVMLSRFPTQGFWTAKVGATIQSRNDDPALALFWAIYKAFGG